MEIQRIGLAVVPAEAARSSETSGAGRQALMRGGDEGPAARRVPLSRQATRPQSRL